MHTCHVTVTVAILPLGQCNGFYMPVQCSLGGKHILVVFLTRWKHFFTLEMVAFPLQFAFCHLFISWIDHGTGDSNLRGCPRSPVRQSLKPLLYIQFQVLPFSLRKYPPSHHSPPHSPPTPPLSNSIHASQWAHAHIKMPEKKQGRCNRTDANTVNFLQS